MCNNNSSARKNIHSEQKYIALHRERERERKSASQWRDVRPFKTTNPFSSLSSNDHAVASMWLETVEVEKHSRYITFPVKNPGKYVSGVHQPRHMGNYERGRSLRLCFPRKF